jgi:predicted alpha/beta-hydrolase family hydrolase
VTDVRIRVDETREVDGLLDLGSGADTLLVLAHGAGAPMRHVFLEGFSKRAGSRGLATLRFNFPYVQRGAKAPDPPAVLMATVRAAVEAAGRLAPDLPLVAGGKSMGGRMTSQAMAEEAHPRVRGVFFLGFPLHAAGRPSASRGAHLVRVPVPMLFLQGTRDPLADLSLLRPIVESLGERATLHVVEDGDHGFHVRKRSGSSDAEVLDTLVEATAAWARRLG